MFWECPGHLISGDYIRITQCHMLVGREMYDMTKSQ